jgi:2-keto-4-pentenoate hydratase
MQAETHVITFVAQPEPIENDGKRYAALVIDMQNDFGARDGMFNWTHIPIAHADERQRGGARWDNAVPGDSVKSMIWLARKLVAFRLALEASDLIMTGSISRMFLLARGDRARAEFEGLGAVEVGIAA